MNHALVARSQDYDVLDDNIENTDEDQKTNTYGLMIGNGRTLND